MQYPGDKAHPSEGVRELYIMVVLAGCKACPVSRMGGFNTQRASHGSDNI